MQVLQVIGTRCVACEEDAPAGQSEWRVTRVLSSGNQLQQTICTECLAVMMHELLTCSPDVRYILKVEPL